MNFHISTSFGIVLFPQDGEDPETLLCHADLAPVPGKESGAEYLSVLPLNSTVVSNARFLIYSQLNNIF